MNRSRINQAGFGAVGVLVGLLLVAVIAGVGYKVVSMNKLDTTSQIPAATTAPETIQTQADLTATGKSLDQSGSQLDSGLDDSSLDADLNTML
ncbi:MAG TPA: hypothetical protein VF575_02240 [Candidatus Saccharimonadales bacterium]|jgi:hypothetical protein